MLALYAATTSTTPGAKDAANSFRAADVNRDGVLTQAEFSRWFQIAERGAADTEASSPPTAKQLFHVMLRNGVPFVGFGFLDNAGMIIFGEYIDDTIGAAFRLSTMASAGLGNAVSDVLGLGFGKVIESISIRLGLPDPKVCVPRVPPPSHSSRLTPAGGRVGRMRECSSRRRSPRCGRCGSRGSWAPPSGSGRAACSASRRCCSTTAL